MVRLLIPETPRILDWVQMAGRGGRGIAMSYSITISPCEDVFRWQSLSRDAEVSHPERLEAIKDIIISTTVIRPKLATFLDGADHLVSSTKQTPKFSWLPNKLHSRFPPKPPNTHRTSTGLSI